jgi:hypothetical protein
MVAIQAEQAMESVTGAETAPREALGVPHRQAQGHPEHRRGVRREAHEEKTPTTPKASPKGSIKVVKDGKSVKDTPPAVKLPGRDKKKSVKLPPKEKKKPVRK